MFVQLLKTTPYLSGQHRLDVCLKKTKYDPSYAYSTQRFSPNYDPWYITTGECHLAPLSDGLVYTDSIERPFFSQTYGDNLKQLYKSLKDDFFRDVPAIKSKNILYEENNTWVDGTDHTYECGLKRLRYKKYNKQFSWLCPIWIENKNDIINLNFIMTVYGDEANAVSMKFKINLAKDLKDSLREWLNNISSDLLYIDIKNEKATITGASVESGTPVTANISYIVPQLINRERPVMETNSTLNQLFATNKIIARQLINFNFCFSPEDVIPSHMIKEMIGKRWKITIDAYDGVKQLDKVDFFSNYEFVPSYVSNNNVGVYDSSLNTLDYLEDNKYIDYMYINKTTQVDPYWSLVENPKSIYNFYNGFSSWYTDGLDLQGNPRYYQTKGLTQDQPDTAHLEYTNKYNNIGWCTVYDYSTVVGDTNNDNTFALLQALISGAYPNSKKATEVELKSKQVCWIGGLKFDLTKSAVAINTKFKFMICLTGDDISKKMYLHHFQNLINTSEDFYCLFVPTQDITGNNPNYYLDMLTAKSLSIKSPVSNNFHNSDISPLYNIFIAFKYLVFPEKIFFSKSIQAVPAESPFNDSKEITYIKQEYNLENYIFRYSGGIRPYFISPKDPNFYNIDYYFKKWNQSYFQNTTIDPEYEDLQKYNKFLNTGYEAVFPSVGYYALEKGKQNHNNINYNNGRLDYFVYPKRYENSNCEFSWYMDGRFYFIPNEIELSFITNANVTKDTILQKLKQELYTNICYNISSIGIEQLANLYDYTLDYDYVSPTDITNQIFKVKYILR